MANSIGIPLYRHSMVFINRTAKPMGLNVEGRLPWVGQSGYTSDVLFNRSMGDQ